MTEIEIKMSLKLSVDPKLQLKTVHHSFKEWMKQSSLDYEIEGEKYSAPLRLQDIESSAAHLSYITYTHYDDDGKEDDFIKTKIHVP